MDRRQIINDLRTLEVTQQTVARLVHIPADRLSRFLKNNTPLRDGEAARLTTFIETAFLVEAGAGLPIDWGRVVPKQLEQAEELVLTYKKTREIFAGFARVRE